MKLAPTEAGPESDRECHLLRRGANTATSAVNKFQPMIKAVALVIGTTTALAALSIVGVVVRSNWSSFVPDIIVGVIGAGAIAALIALTTWRAQTRRDRETEVRVAHNDLIAAIADLRGADLSSPQGREAGDAMRKMSVRMGILAELVEQSRPAVEAWFESERQLALAQAIRAAEAVEQLEKDDELHGANEVLEASAPLYRWTAEFTNNLRYWRTGRLSYAQMRRQANRIETALRAENAWHEAFSWRNDR